MKDSKKYQRFTCILIPQNTSAPLKFTLSKKYINLVIGIVTTLIFAFFAICYLFYSSQSDIKRVNELKETNLKKDQEIKSLQAELKKIKEEQNTLSRKQNEIKKLMGLSLETSSDPSRGGVGGADESKTQENFDYTEFNLTDMYQSLSMQEEEIDKLLVLAKNNSDYYCHMPNQWPVEGEITSYYGWRRSPFGGRKSTFHDGIDIGNNVGTEVVTAADGKVISSGWIGVYGKMIVIDHGNGFVTKYGHNSSLLVKKGDEVKKGDTIALLGNTGRSTGPHLHFTIMKDNKTQDPLLYLP